MNGSFVRSLVQQIPFRRIGQVAVLAWMLSHFESARSEEGTAPVRSDNRGGVAVVELFTSQGCSSCPPADETLQQIAVAARSNDLPVYTLSFHVDYWNRLGWTDPYSDPTYTKRQQAYARAIRSTRIYTPQMIVNGTTEFVGSHRSKANDAIKQALLEPAAVDVTIQIERNENLHAIVVEYQIGDGVIGQLLHLAVVHSPDANSVPRGENIGRELAHVNVVRAFESVRITEPAGSIEIAVTQELDLAKALVIAYIQNPQTRTIMGATASHNQ